MNGKILIDYILSEIDEFKEILIVANKSIRYMQSNKISKISDHQMILVLWRCINKVVKKNGKNTNGYQLSIRYSFLQKKNLEFLQKY